MLLLELELGSLEIEGLKCPMIGVLGGGFTYWSLCGIEAISTH